MALAWKVLSGDDLWKVVSRSSVLKVNEDSAGGSAAGNNLNNSLDTRAKEAVRMAVADVRGAVKHGGKTPVSLTVMSVPPEAEWHTLALAAWRFCTPVPGLLSIIMSDGGSFSPISRMVTDANKWLEATRNGQPVTEPTDPTGDDYATAPGDDNPEVRSVRWGDAQGTSVAGTSGEIDMTTDGPWNGATV